MREDVKITKVYRFDELTEEAKEKAIDQFYDINVGYEWWYGVCGDAKTIGLEITEFDIDRGSYCRVKWIEDAEDVARLILENHGTVCETHKDATAFLADLSKTRDAHKDRQTAIQKEYEYLVSKNEDRDDYDPEYEEFTDSDQYQELCEEFQRTICEDYRIILQKEYEYLTSKEAIIETIEVNEYEFTEDGKLYN